jgi:hypothetical protein
MSNLQKDTMSAKKFMGLFKEQQCRLSNRSKDILTASSIAVAGASDKGVQSVIFGTLKAVVKEMGVKLSHKQLANGCPSKVTAQLVKLQITLVTEHGNRDGFDYLVKMICWSSWDENGNHCLRHFNVNV